MFSYSACFTDHKWSTAWLFSLTWLCKYLFAITSCWFWVWSCSNWADYCINLWLTTLRPASYLSYFSFMVLRCSSPVRFSRGTSFSYLSFQESSSDPNLSISDSRLSTSSRRISSFLFNYCLNLAMVSSKLALPDLNSDRTVSKVALSSSVSRSFRVRSSISSLYCVLMLY